MRWSHPIRWSLAAAAAMLLSLFQPPVASADYRQATLVEFADIYSGPGEDYYVVEDGEEGDSFPVLEEKKGWVKLRLSTGTGWVEKSKVEMSSVEGEDSAPAAGEDDGDGEARADGAAKARSIEGVIKKKTAKLFSEPTTTSIVVKKLRKGTNVEVVERSEDGKWYKVRHDGPMAWVRAGSVRLVGLEKGADPVEIPTAGDEHFRVMGKDEMAQASAELGTELRLWAGVGEARLRQRWDANATGSYRFPNYKPPFKYDLSTPGPAVSLGAAFWFMPNWGVQATSRLVLAHKGIEVNDKDYTAEPVRLTITSTSADLAGQVRYPFFRPGAFFVGRLGYRYYKFAWDRAQPDPAEIKGANSPLFWTTIYHGPLLGLGLRYPFTSWLGIEGNADVVPYGFARNDVVGGTADTPSGDLSGAWGFTTEVSFWVQVFHGPPVITAEIKGFYDFYKSSYTVPEGAEVPRALPPYLAYSEATSDEQAGGAAVALSVRF